MPIQQSVWISLGNSNFCSGLNIFGFQLKSFKIKIQYFKGEPSSLIIYQIWENLLSHIYLPLFYWLPAKFTHFPPEYCKSRSILFPWKLVFQLRARIVVYIRVFVPLLIYNYFIVSVGLFVEQQRPYIDRSLMALGALLFRRGFGFREGLSFIQSL